MRSRIAVVSFCCFLFSWSWAVLAVSGFCGLGCEVSGFSLEKAVAKVSRICFVLFLTNS